MGRQKMRAANFCAPVLTFLLAAAFAYAQIDSQLGNVLNPGASFSMRERIGRQSLGPPRLTLSCGARMSDLELIRWEPYEMPKSLNFVNFKNCRSSPNYSD